MDGEQGEGRGGNEKWEKAIWRVGRRYSLPGGCQLFDGEERVLSLHDAPLEETRHPVKATSNIEGS